MYARPRTFYFGPGDYHYKRLFANGEGLEATLVISKKTVFNRGKFIAHRGFRAIVDGLKLVKGAVTCPGC